MTLEEICRSVIEAGEKATKRPWRVDPDHTSFVDKKYLGDLRKYTICEVGWHGDMTEDTNYIVTSANHAVQIAKALLVMRNGLEKCASHSHGDPAWIVHYSDEAIKKAEEIMKGEK